jgi:hypothetical protein
MQNGEASSPTSGHRRTRSYRPSAAPTIGAATGSTKVGKRERRSRGCWGDAHLRRGRRETAGILAGGGGQRRPTAVECGSGAPVVVCDRKECVGFGAARRVRGGRDLLQQRSIAAIHATAGGARLGSGELQAVLRMQGSSGGGATARARAASSSALYRARQLALACRARTPRGGDLAMPGRDCRVSMGFGWADSWARAGAGRAHGLGPAR